jgi:hypothetical protein
MVFDPGEGIEVTDIPKFTEGDKLNEQPTLSSLKPSFEDSVRAREIGIQEVYGGRTFTKRSDNIQSDNADSEDDGNGEN